MRVRMGNGGWFRVEDVPGINGPTYVRFQLVDGRARITELYIDGRGEPVQATAVRRLPLAAWESEAAASYSDQPDGGELDLMGAEAGGTPGPDLSRLASYFASTFKSQEQHWIADSWRAQFPDSAVPQPPYARSLGTVQENAEEIVLAPPAAGLTDAFLSDVARAYRVALNQGKPPATALAVAAGVDRRLVESWIYKARKRGIMPAAPKRGRVR